MMTVSVVGLVPETVPLSDIGYDVPHGVVVHIPAEKANNSKELWRALSQRRIFRLQGGPFMPTSRPGPNQEVEALRVRVAELEAENGRLRTALAQRELPLPADGGKLDEILALLKQGGGVAVGAAPVRSAPRASAVVEVETPAFIPSVTRVEPQESRVEVQETATEGGGVADAKSALRKLRRDK